MNERQPVGVVANVMLPVPVVVDAVGAATVIGLFAGIDECRFKRIVQPGDRMTLEVTMEKLGRRFGKGRAVASVDGEVCCEARISFVIPPAEALR